MIHSAKKAIEDFNATIKNVQTNSEEVESIVIPRFRNPNTTRSYSMFQGFFGRSETEFSDAPSIWHLLLTDADKLLYCLNFRRKCVGRNRVDVCRRVEG